jgi:hypothetical protein
MKNATELGSGAIIYITSFIKIRSGIQKRKEGDMHTDPQRGDPINLIYF